MSEDIHQHRDRFLFDATCPKCTAGIRTITPAESLGELRDGHGPGHCVSVEDANRVLAEERDGRDRQIERLRATVKRVEGELANFRSDVETEFWHGNPVAGDLYWAVYGALNGPTPSAGSTDTRPAPAGAHDAAQGAGDGV